MSARDGFTRNLKTWLTKRNGECLLEDIEASLQIPNYVTPCLEVYLREFDDVFELSTFGNRTRRTCKVRLVGQNKKTQPQINVETQTLLVFLQNRCGSSRKKWPATEQELRTSLSSRAAASVTSFQKNMKDLGYLAVVNGDLVWDLARIAEFVANRSRSARTDADPQTAAPTSLKCRVGGSAVLGPSNQNSMHQPEKLAFKCDTHFVMIDDPERLRHVVAADLSLQGVTGSGSSEVVTIDLEKCGQALQPVQIATRSSCYIFDIAKLQGSLFWATVRPLLESPSVIKLVHDLYATSLSECDGCRVDTLLDSQLAGELLFGDYSLSLVDMLRKMEQTAKVGALEFFTARIKANGSKAWAKRPLSKTNLEFAALKVSTLHAASLQIISTCDKSLRILIQASVKRSEMLRRSCYSAGNRAFCFDKSKEYEKASPELLELTRKGEGIFGRPLVVECESEDAVQILPASYRSKLGAPTETAASGSSIFARILSGDDFPTPVVAAAERIDLRTLSDFTLDIGKRPQCWANGKRIYLCDDEKTLVREEDIDHITCQLGAIGSDNRAGLDGKLHRFSVMRARDDAISCITIRLGRCVTGNADIFRDYLLASDKSILFLGEPGSGKTTIVREATRILAEERHVLVVDTSNEIAGDGMRAHKCIGEARRMMVPSLDKQGAVMIECVQNHTPWCMVIDEIGRPAEVAAARTVKQRGVRIIASAHGDLRKLVKNKELRGLIGGLVQETMGDDMAREEHKRKQQLLKQDGIEVGGTAPSKTRVQRAADPTFDVIVELRRGAYHEWRIVGDSGKAVDRILEGRQYHAEVRRRDPETGAMYSEQVTA